MKRMPGRRLTAVAITCLSVTGGLVISAPAASADTLDCLAPVYGVQQDNNQAIQDDVAGNTSAAAAQDASSAYNRTEAIPECYYNPDVPYNIYLDVTAGFGYVAQAETQNNAGQAAAALASGRTAAGYLNTAVTYLLNSDAP